jgi:copper chaperone CopZ
MGRRTALIYLGTVALSAVGFGVLLNWIAPRAAAAIPQLAIHTHGTSEPSLLFHLVAIALLLVLLNAYLGGRLARLRPQPAGTPSSHPAGSAGPGAEQVQVMELTITGMNCSHCTESVRRAITHCDGVISVDVNLDQGRATVRGANLDPTEMMQVVSSLGYQTALAGTPGSES